METFQLAQAQAAVAKRIIPPEGSHLWQKPRRGRYRLDVDYAVNEMRGSGGVGAIVRDSMGSIVFAMAKSVVVATSTLHGELKAMMHGICQCIDDGLSPVEVFTDSMLAVIAVGEEREEASVLYKDLFEFFEMVKELNVIEVRHVRREANKAAHELACFAKNISSTLVWHDNWPEWLLRIVNDDL